MQNNKGGEKLSFEDCYLTIEKKIEQFRKKWTLTSISWFDFDDVKQQLRAHIYKKWDKWNQERPIGPWLQTTISNQIKNIVRDNYQIYSRPCLKCKYMTDQDGCQLFGKQCQKCELFKKWNKQKSNGNNINLAVSYTNDEKKQLLNNILSIKSDDIDYEKAIITIRREQQKNLPHELFVLFDGCYLTGDMKQVQREQRKFLKDNKAVLYTEVRRIIEEFELIQDVKINHQEEEENE